MALASLTVDLVANLGKFEGDFGKAAQIVARNSEKMTGAQRAFLKQLERTGERAGKTEAEFLAIKAATLGMSDAYERYVGNLSAGQSAVTAAASGVSETYRASGAAAQAAGDKQVSVNAQLADSIRQVRAAYDQQREAAIAANKAGALSDDGLKARLGGLGSQFNDSVAQLKAQIANHFRVYGELAGEVVQDGGNRGLQMVSGAELVLGCKRTQGCVVHFAKVNRNLHWVSDCPVFL